MFYTNAHSCALNNCHMKESFRIERGVRQGCTLSPYLFITVIELLSHQIEHNNNIKGIVIENTKIKETLFADDATFVTDGSEKTNLIDVLDEFALISGLKLNNSKCNVLRAGSLKTSNTQYLKQKPFTWSSESAKAIGIIFTTNRSQTLKLNLDPKIEEFKNCLKQWQHRKLTLLGKITVIKTFALPKLIYPLTVLKTPSSKIIKDIDDIMFDFLWDGKPSAIRKDIITRDYD